MHFALLKRPSFLTRFRNLFFGPLNGIGCTDIMVSFTSALWTTHRDVIIVDDLHLFINHIHNDNPVAALEVMLFAA